MAPKTRNAFEKRPWESTRQDAAQPHLRTCDTRRFKGPENQERFRRL